MTCSPAEFDQGLTYKAYKSQMSRNRDRLETNEQTAMLNREDVLFFAHLQAPLNVLVITEDWCEPALVAVPVLARLAAESHNLTLRFFLRDQNPGIMNRFLKDGLHQTIPAFVFFTQDFQELGRWYERPAVISERLEQLLSDLYRNDPAFEGLTRETSLAQVPDAARSIVIKSLIAFRAETHRLCVQEIVRETRQLIEAALAVTCSI